MSEKILFGTLDTIELLLFLSSLGGEFITSSKIRERFPKIAGNTLNMKLNKLVEQEFVERVEKERKTAGADRMEYKLTQKGRNMTDTLVTLNIQILQTIIDNRAKNKLLALEQKEMVIDKVLTDFFEQNKNIVKKEVLSEQIKILKEILERNLS